MIPTEVPPHLSDTDRLAAIYAADVGCSFTEARFRVSAASPKELHALRDRFDPLAQAARSIPMRTTRVGGDIALFRGVDGSLGMRDVRRITAGSEVDPAAAGVALKGKATWKDGTPKKLVWVHLAECGEWSGHPAGPFEMTPRTFDEIVRNFDARGLPVPFDYEHASESAPTEGSVPQRGSPAPGWVHKLENRGRVAGLWGLVEWLDQAREQILEGAYGFLSPAVRFGSKDPVTGQPIGARLTSVALTNQPFLTHLEDLRAARAR